VYSVHVSGRNRNPEDDGHSLNSNSQLFLRVPEIHVTCAGLWYVVKEQLFFLSILFPLLSLFVFSVVNCLLFLFVSFLSCTLLVIRFALLWSLEAIAANTVANCLFVCFFVFYFPSVQIMSQEPENNVRGITVATVYDYMGKK